MAARKSNDLWYRHSGEVEIDQIPHMDSIRRVPQSCNDVIQRIGHHHITHFSACIREGEELPSLEMICPHVTDLQIKCISIDRNKSKELLKAVAQLKSLKRLYLDTCHVNDLPESMDSAPQLMLLHILNDDLSGGVPNVISQCTSLEKLYLYSCKVKDLPMSMMSLQRLKILHIHINDFSKGVPAIISQLTSLITLDIETCKVTDLPHSFCQLENLEELKMRNNDFASLPAVICKLSNLKLLDVRYSKKLLTIDKDLLQVGKLDTVQCEGCESLVTPPYAVCQQGLPAIKKYYIDLGKKAGTEVTVVPVAVVGNLMAGKTSLIRSLKSGKRELTFREESSPLDETTKVFKLESLEFADSTVRLIDFGGHEVYHMAYQLTTKEQCIPCIVVNMEAYKELTLHRTPKEATRRLCFDWISHLYLACPRLKAPILILTHKDKLSDEEFAIFRSQLLTSADIIRKELHEEEAALSDGQNQFCQILHFSSSVKSLFEKDDIFALSDDKNITDTILRVKKSLERRCSEFKMVIPGDWERVNLFIDGDTSKPFVLLSDIKREFPDDEDIVVILRYLHNSGKVLWFEQISSLKDYIFHQIPEITSMIELIFDHSGKQKWEERIANTRAFKYRNVIIENEYFRQLVKQFTDKGIMHEAILVNLLENETKFPGDIAKELLKSFCIIHGAIKHGGENAYIIPYFSTDYRDRKWICDGDLQLRVDVLFKGLLLPKYVFQLMTVAALNFLSDLTNSVKVANNGATVLHGQTSTHFIHDYNNSKVIIQVSTPVELIGSSWQRLIELTQNIIGNTLRVWKAARPVYVFYCSHCLFIGEDNPGTEINPPWFRCAHLQLPDGPKVTTFTGVEPVACTHERFTNENQLTVPKPLRYPCYQLNEREVAKLEEYLASLKQSRSTTSTGCATTQTAPFYRQTYSSDDEQYPTTTHALSSHIQSIPIEVIALQPSSPTSEEDHRLQISVHTENEEDSDLSDQEDETHEPRTSSDTEHDADSVLSDVGERGYVDFHRTDNLHIEMSLKPCTKQSITRLYFNSDKVYPMSDGVRGRVLVLNNTFSDDSEKKRLGASVDFSNIKRLFKKLNFEVVYKPDLTAEEMMRAVREETQLPVHHRYSMFVMVLMSHGHKGDIISGADNRPVTLAEIKDLLSVSEFPAMKGKPKLIIVQACSGDRVDYGDFRGNAQAASREQVDTIPNQSTEGGEVTAGSNDVNHPSVTVLMSENVTLASAVPGAIWQPSLDMDDFFVMKASSESYGSPRSRTHGSRFIRILVATFYSHACHRDLETLFKIIQKRVRDTSIASISTTGQAIGGVIPTCYCTFTNYRKLYFFPGYSSASNTSS